MVHDGFGTSQMESVLEVIRSQAAIAASAAESQQQPQQQSSASTGVTDENAGEIDPALIHASHVAGLSHAKRIRSGIEQASKVR